MPRPPHILQIVGLQNAGKTELVCRLVHEVHRRGLRAGVVKHDGHAQRGKQTDWEKPDSDTVRYRDAGAAMTTVAGGGQWLLHNYDYVHGYDAMWHVETLTRQAERMERPLDYIFVEGWKRDKLPKIVVVREVKDERWLSETKLSNVVGIYLADTSLVGSTPAPYPVYHAGDEWQILERLDDSSQTDT